MAATLHTHNTVTPSKALALVAAFAAHEHKHKPEQKSPLVSYASSDLDSHSHSHSNSDSSESDLCRKFCERYPLYGYNGTIQDLRVKEFPQLNGLVLCVCAVCCMNVCVHFMFRSMWYVCIKQVFSL